MLLQISGISIILHINALTLYDLFRYLEKLYVIQTSKQSNSQTEKNTDKRKEA